MNETSIDPEGLDDPALLAEIEAEFAELTREIQRISAMPATPGPQKSALIDALRSSWRQRLEDKVKDKPEWRQRLDATIGDAVDRLLQEGIVENADGSLAFALRSETLKQEGGPLLKSLIEGFAHMMAERFPPPDKAPQPAPGAPPNPMQSLLGGLGHLLAGALKSAVGNIGADGKGGFATDQGNVKVSVTPAGGSVVKAGDTVDAGTFAFKGEHDLSTTFEIDTRKQREEAARAAEAAGEAQGAPTGGAGPAKATTGAQIPPAANLFFQQLLAGLGQVVRQAVTPPAPAPSQPPGQTTTQPPGPTPPEGAAAATQAPKPPPQAPSPLVGIGQLVAQVLQKAMTSAAPTAAPATPPAVPATPPAAHVTPPVAETATPVTPTHAAAETATPATPTPAAAETATPTHAAAETVTPTHAAAETAAPEGTVRLAQTNAAPDQKPASLQVDLAGLLQSLLGNIKLPPKG